MSDITVHKDGSMTCTCGWKVEYNTTVDYITHNCVLFLKVKVEELEKENKKLKLEMADMYLGLALQTR